MKICSGLIRPIDIGKILSIPDEESKYWDECREFDGILVVTKLFSTYSELERTWRDTVHFVAGYIQSNLDKLGFSESMSDVYLFLGCQESMPLETILTIEQDKFCCKKYIIKLNDNDDIWQRMTEKMPIFSSWEHEKALQNYIGNLSNIKEKLIEGNSSPLADIFISERDFENIETTTIIDRLIGEES